MTTTPRGFVALMSVVIIAAILLVFIFGLGAASFFSRFDSLDGENKRESLALAEACVNAAMLRSVQGLSNSNICINSLGGTCGGADPQKVCKICSESKVGTVSTILTRALYNHTYTNIRAIVNIGGGTYTVQSWAEEATGDPSCALP